MDVFNFFELPGASVTMPFKVDVMSSIDKVDTHAKRIGAVNTLVRKGKKIHGYNTDWVGAKKALGKHIYNKKILILGSGGAASAIYYAAINQGAKEVDMLTHSEMPTDEDDFDVLINATPVYDMLLVPEDSLYSKVIMDCNYSMHTQLLKTAKQTAHVVMDGLPMLLYQGAGQYKLWTDKSMPVKEILALLQQRSKL